VEHQEFPAVAAKLQGERGGGQRIIIKAMSKCTHKQMFNSAWEKNKPAQLDHQKINSETD
jgi:hypothetical protein